LDTSLKKLGTDYVDLYLMHWPQALRQNGMPNLRLDHTPFPFFFHTGAALAPDDHPTLVDTWKDMEHLLDSGKVRSIGVSNFSIKTLTTVIEHSRIVPAVNQVEAHPCLPQHQLLVFCRERRILLTAYSPVGKHKYASHPSITRIAQENGITAAQVLLSWGVTRGTVVIPKSEQEERIRENISLVRLTPHEMGILDALHEEPGMHQSVCGFHSAELGGSCFGWTYEQLGWDMTTGGVVP